MTERKRYPFEPAECPHCPCPEGPCHLCGAEKSTIESVKPQERPLNHEAKPFDLSEVDAFLIAIALHFIRYSAFAIAGEEGTEIAGHHEALAQKSLISFAKAMKYEYKGSDKALLDLIGRLTVHCGAITQEQNEAVKQKLYSAPPAPSSAPLDPKVAALMTMLFPSKSNGRGGMPS